MIRPRRSSPAFQGLNSGLTLITLLLLVPFTLGGPSERAVASTVQMAAGLSEHDRYLIASFTFQSAAAEASFKRQLNDRLVAQRSVIVLKDTALSRLRVALASANGGRDNDTVRLTALEHEIVTLKEIQIAALASKDASFQREREIYQTATSGILRTPEGQRALESYLAGGSGAAEVAVHILQEVASKRTAADLRAMASSIGDDALAKGQLTTQAVLTLWQKVVAADPQDSEAWLRIADLQLQLGMTALAEQASKAAINNALDDDQRRSAEMTAGDVYARQYKFQKAVDHYDLALESIKRRATPPYASLRPIDLLDSNDMSLRIAAIQVLFGSTDRALEISGSMLSTLVGVPAELYLDPTFDLMRARIWLTHAYTLSENDRFKDAAIFLEKSETALLDLKRRHPGLIEVDTNLSLLYDITSSIMFKQKKYPDARRKCKASIAIGRTLVNLDNNNIDIISSLADALVMHAEVDFELGNLAESRRYLAEGIALNRQASSSVRKEAPVQIELARAVLLDGRLKAAAANKAAAEASFLEANALFAQAAEKMPLNHDVESGMAETLRGSAMIHNDANSWSNVVSQLTWMQHHTKFDTNDEVMLLQAQARAVSHQDRSTQK